MQEISTIIDMSATTTTTATISTKVENVDNLADDEVGLNSISDSSINGSRDESVESNKSSTDSNNSSSRSTPTPTGSNTSITPPITTPLSAINDKPKDEEGEDDNKDAQSSVSGGQLKFFKDGLLCLQLEHQNSGKRSKWVQIRTRTVFPSLVHVTKEVSIPCQLSPPPNSFNVSDEGSSMLSSPIVRESSWKQQIPRKGASNVLLQFFMTPAPCIKRRRKILYHKFPRLTRQPYKSWMRKFSSCTTIIPTTTKLNQSSETTEPTQCLECDEHVVEDRRYHQKRNALNLSADVSAEKGDEAIVVPLIGGSQHKSISKKKKQLHYCISRLSARIEKNPSPPQANSDRESELSTNHSSGGETHQNSNNSDGSNNKTPVKNVRVASNLPLTNSHQDLESCRDLIKNNSNSNNSSIRPKITEKRLKMLGVKDKTTILSVPLTAGKLIHRQMIKTDHDNNLPIDFSKMAESSSSSSSSPSIYHHLQQQQQSDRRDIKSDSKLKKSLKREKVLDQQRQKGTVSSHKSHHHSNSSTMNNHSDRKNLQSSGSSTSSCESAALNLSSSSNQQCFSPNVKPFTLGSLSFAANQLYPINYLSVLAASSTPATSSAASPSSLNSATFPSYSNASGLNFQQQLLQQHTMSSVISETVNSLLAANKVNNNDYNSSDRAKKDSKDNSGHSLSVVQRSNDSGSLLKQMQHNNKLSKTKKTSSVNSKFKIPEFNANHPSSSKSNSSTLLNYFGNSNAQQQQSLLEIASSSPISRISSTLDNSKQNSFLRNLLDTSYPIPSNKTEAGGRGDILQSNASKSLHNLISSKTKISNAEVTGNVRAKSSHHQSVNAKQIKSNISNFNHAVAPYHLPYSFHSKSTSSLPRSSSSKYSTKSNSSDRDKGKERSASSSPSTATTNFRTSSSQRPDLSHHDPTSILRSPTLNSTTTSSAFHNSLLSGSILPPGFSPGAMAAAAAAAANYFKNPQSNDFNSLLSGMSAFDYASALNSSQKLPVSWSSFLPFPVGTGDAVGAGEGSAFRLLHPSSLATTLTSAASEPIASALKYNDSSSDAPLNLCKKSRPN